MSDEGESNKRRGCAVCKQPIEAERLEAIPGTVLCIQHAQAIKRFGDEFKRNATQSQLSKSTSLKRNYGDITVELEFDEEVIQRLRDEYERGNL